MNEKPVDETDSNIINDIVYGDNDTAEQKFWKFCNDITVPRSEVVFLYQINFAFLFCLLLSLSIFKLF